MILKDNAKILIINPFGIGDVLFTTPVIQTIKSVKPNTIISYWCNQRVKDIFENNLNIDKIFALSRGDLKKIYFESRFKGIKKFLILLYQLKKESFDLTFDFSLDQRYSLISKLLGIRKRIGFNYKGRGRFLTHKIDIDGYSQKHIVEYYLDLLRFIGIEPKNSNLVLFVSEADKISARTTLGKVGISNNDLVVAIAPGAGASWGKDAEFKHWPATNFARLSDKIIANFGAKVIILGDILERSIANIINYTSYSKLIDLVGRTDLRQLITIINNLHLLITNDGGPLHIAVALGIKNSVNIWPCR